MIEMSFKHCVELKEKKASHQTPISSYQYYGNYS